MNYGGILTRSGREVTHDTGVPSITDIAYSLAGQARFAAHLNRRWSIGHHSLFVAQLSPQLGPEVNLLGLMHDAHESVTSDVPSPFKPVALKDIQKDKLDARIFDEYYPGGPVKANSYVQFITDLDRRALLAEAFLFGPEVLRISGGMTHYYGNEPSPRDVDNLRAFSEKYPAAQSEEFLAQEFLMRYYELRAQVIVASQQQAQIKPARITTPILGTGPQPRC